MILTLYTSTSDKNRIDKSAFLTTLVTLTGTMKTESSIINPIIAIDLSQESVIVDDDSLEVASDGKSIIGDTLANLLKANYAYIPDFNRYYFITNIVQVTTFILRFELSCDCLMSYQEEIYSLSALVTRNETTFDPLMEDTNNQLSFKKEVTYNTDIFGNLVNFSFSTATFTRYNFVINTITPNVDFYSNYVNAPNNTDLPSIMTEEFSGSHACVPYAISKDSLESIAFALYNNDTLQTFIKSIVAYPFNLKDYNSQEDKAVYFGTDTITYKDDPEHRIVYGHVLKSIGSTYHVLADFTMPNATSYLDYNPYKHYELFVPFHGFVELDMQKLSGHRIILYYIFNYEDGTANAYIHDVTENDPIFSAVCQIGTKISLSSSNLLENEKQRTANGTNLAIGLVSSAVSVGVGIATYNPVAIAGGILAGVKTTANFINSNAMIFDRAQVSFSDPFNSLYSRLTPFIRVTSSVPQITEDYSKMFGRPLYKVVTLSILKNKGFTIASNFRLEHFPGATTTELDNIRNYLTNGVIL